jgi:hypothetical protein
MRTLIAQHCRLIRNFRRGTCVLLFAILATSCKEKKTPVNGNQDGTLVCAETMLVAQDSSNRERREKIWVVNCPMLGLGHSFPGKDGELLPVISPGGIQGWVRKDSARVIGSFSLPGRFTGFTSAMVFRETSTLTQGVVTIKEERGIILSKQSGLDTLYPNEMERLIPVVTQNTTLQECLEHIGKSDFAGMVTGAFLPPVNCRFTASESWVWDKNENGKYRLSKGSEDIRVEGLNALARLKDHPNSFWAEFKTTRGRVWIFSWNPSTSILIKPNLEYPPLVTRIGIGRFHGDSLPAFAVESIHHYGDGYFTQLNLFHSPDQSHSPSLQVFPLSGSSGEEGGQTLNGTWWIDGSSSDPTLYIVSQEEEGKEFHAETFRSRKNGLGPIGLGEWVFGLSLSTPQPSYLAKIELEQLKFLTRTDLGLFPDEAGRRWFVGRLFLNGAERSHWLVGMAKGQHLFHKEFQLEPTRKSE